MHVHDLVPYLQGEGDSKHDFGHEIHHFSFSSEHEDEFFSTSSSSSGKRKANSPFAEPSKVDLVKKTKKELGIVDPLDGIKAHTEESN